MSRWVIEKSKAELSTVDSSRDSVDSGTYGVGNDFFYQVMGQRKFGHPQRSWTHKIVCYLSANLKTLTLRMVPYPVEELFSYLDRSNAFHSQHWSTGGKGEDADPGISVP